MYRRAYRPYPSLTHPFFERIVKLPVYISRMCQIGEIVCQEPRRSHKNADLLILRGQLQISRFAA